MKNKIKEKVLKEVFKTYGILPNQFIEIKHKKVGNTAINIELPLSLTADLTLAEVGKVIDEKVSILKTGCQVLVNQIKKLKGEKKKFVFKQAELMHIRIEELEELKQKLGVLK